MYKMYIVIISDAISLNVTQVDMREKQHDCHLQQQHGEKQITEVKIKQEGFWDAELGREKTIEGGEFVLILSNFI